ncbi:unnamed protein product [Caenorhabditis nigoni]
MDLNMEQIFPNQAKRDLCRLLFKAKRDYKLPKKEKLQEIYDDAEPRSEMLQYEVYACQGQSRGELLLIGCLSTTLSTAYDEFSKFFI